MPNGRGFRDHNVWYAHGVREWSGVAREAASQGKEIHMGRLFGLCVQKGSELPKGDERRTYKYRVVLVATTNLTRHGSRLSFRVWAQAPPP